MFKRPLRLASLLFTLVLLAGWSPYAQPSKAQSSRSQTGNFDIRAVDSATLAAVLARHTPQGIDQIARTARTKATAMQTGLARLQTVAAGAEARFSSLTAAPEVVRNPRGALTNAAPGVDGRTIALDFLRANKALYGLSDNDLAGLHYIGESVSKASGLRMVRLEQQVNGLPVFQSDTRILLNRDGRLFRTVGLFIPGASAVAAPAQTLSAPAALKAALASLNIAVDAQSMDAVQTDAASMKYDVRANTTLISGVVPSRMVYFPLAPGVLVPAWSQVIFTTTDADWYTLVDAQTGDLLWRKNIRSDGSSDTQPATLPIVAPSAASMLFGRQFNTAPATSAPRRVALAPSTQDARFSVYVQADGTTPADNPAPQSPTNAQPGNGTQFPAISRTNVSMLAAQDSSASPEGWIPDGANTTTGNNTDTYLDADATQDTPDTGALDNNGRPVGNLDANSRQRDFLGTGYAYTPAPTGSNPNAGTAPTDTQFRRGAVTQLFYVTNWYHDQLYNLGFDEAGGNFQNTNFSGQGMGNDRVLAEAQDGSGTDNANFSTPPDGTSGRMQMYRFSGPTPDRDGDLDSEIVIHELTHGLSNRLVGDGNGLLWDAGGGMGEGWSDFYALSLLNGTSADDPDAKYATGAYATYQLGGLTDNYLYGIRRFPYSTDNSVNPLTWADVDDTTYNLAGGITTSPLDFSASGAFEVHNVGEIWALSLWEVRSRIIADSAGANHDVPTGNQTMLQLTTDALKMTPLNPSFTEARDALIDADCATNNCANERSIWAGFADRGLGYNAIASLGEVGWFFIGGHLGVGESFKQPYLDIADITIDDSRGNNNGAIDPGEPVALTVNLTNPWRSSAMNAPSANAVLSTGASGITLLKANATYGAIAAQGTTSGTPFIFTLNPGATCGESVNFTITTQSVLGSAAVPFTLRIGEANGTAAPVTYTRTIAGGLPIPDGDYQGVTDSQVINDDLEIADLNFRVDRLDHTWTGDLGIMLKGPNGYGTDMIYRRGSITNLNLGDGTNFINTLIDDEATGDLMTTQPTDAPFTGSWKPAFNSPSWGSYNVPNLGPDPIGQLSRFDGLSTKGTWFVHINDVSTPDSGTLRGWSLIVTPKAFSCSTFTPAGSVIGTKSVAGVFLEGNTITYTITLNNNGSGVQTNNPGAEFTDELPDQLTLIGATASAGTAATNVASNTVTWDGSLLPLDSAVVLTITASIDAGTTGETVSNQGNIAYDADLNGSNEASALTDNPATAATNDATTFVVGLPTLSATLSDRLFNDLNGDGKVGPGDTIAYTAVITSSGVPATATVFTATLDSNTTLVAGSVTTTKGSVNTSGGVNVAIGSLLGSATVTYQVKVNDPLATAVNQVASQGTVSGSNFTTLRSDDPDTSAPNDTTVTPITRGGTSGSVKIYLPIVMK